MEIFTRKHLQTICRGNKEASYYYFLVEWDYKVILVKLQYYLFIIIIIYLFLFGMLFFFFIYCWRQGDKQAFVNKIIHHLHHLPSVSQTSDCVPCKQPNTTIIHLLGKIRFLSFSSYDLLCINPEHFCVCFPSIQTHNSYTQRSSGIISCPPVRYKPIISNTHLVIWM